MLELKHISKTFFPGTVNAKTALNDLSLTLHDGDFVTVIGGNGAGKSTMLNAVAGTLTVDSGSILLDGEDITRKPEHRRAADLGRVFQDPMMGTAAMNEYSAASGRRAPRIMPPMMVAAEREKPGNRARHWKQPMPKARPGVMSSRVS